MVALETDSLRRFQPKNDPSFPAGLLGGCEASGLKVTGEPSSLVTSIWRGWLGFCDDDDVIVREGSNICSLGGMGGRSLEDRGRRTLRRAAFAEGDVLFDRKER